LISLAPTAAIIIVGPAVLPDVMISGSEPTLLM